MDVVTSLTKSVYDRVASRTAGADDSKDAGTGRALTLWGVLFPVSQTRACKRKKTLVLDLDETLVHSSLEGFSCGPDFSFMVFFNGQDHEVSVRRRPGLHDFLAAAEELFEVVVFTASQKV